MNCIYCGAQLSNGSVVCTRCGKNVQMVKDIDGLEDEYLAGILEQGQHTDLRNHSEELRKKKQQRLRAKKKRQQHITIGIVVGLLLLIGVTVGVYVTIKIDEQHENSYDYQLSKAESLYAQGDIKESIVYYENALKLEPDHTDVRLKLAQIYYDRKDYDSAQLLYLETLGEDPLNAQCYQMLIAIYELKNKTSEILSLCSDVTDPDILALFSDYIVNAPTFDHESGTYSEYLEISITSDAGHQIYYTLDGTDPSVYGRIYKEPLSLSSMGTYTIRAVCVNSKKLYSQIASETYVIDIPAPSMPVVSPNGGTFEEAEAAVITVPDNCTAYYTWDGTIPNTTSAKYRGPLEIPEGNNILSVMMVDDKTGKWSDIYRGRFVYYPASEEEESLQEEGDDAEASFDEQETE